ncbi:MAG: hypothetical protein AAF431_07095 [Pseudomonadota bacterium]
MKRRYYYENYVKSEAGVVVKLPNIADFDDRAGYVQAFRTATKEVKPMDFNAIEGLMLQRASRIKPLTKMTNRLIKAQQRSRIIRIMVLVAIFFGLTACGGGGSSSGGGQQESLSVNGNTAENARADQCLTFENTPAGDRRYTNICSFTIRTASFNSDGSVGRGIAQPGTTFLVTQGQAIPVACEEPFNPQQSSSGVICRI